MKIMYLSKRAHPRDRGPAGNLQLIASHPPSADTGADYYTRAAYVEDGELDLGRGEAAAGNDTITRLQDAGAPGGDRRRACATGTV